MLQKGNFVKTFCMQLSPEDLQDVSRFRQIESVPYGDLVGFVLDYLRRKTWITLFFLTACIITIGLALNIRISISGYFPFRNILMHTILGFIVFPVLLIPVHELMHIIPFFFTGARRIRIGADLKQYIFYVTAHRHVMSKNAFIPVALVPFAIISVTLIILILYLPGLWKWSLSILLFVHTTMCAGDFAMLNFYFINRKRKIYTWDDADEKMAYFYEEI